MKNMQKLDNLINENPDARLGEKLVFLISDFVRSLTDWQKEIENKSAYGELYLRTWRECRNFVLPMNPQRTELEFAVKEVLGQIGISGRRKKQKSRQKQTKTEKTTDTFQENDCCLSSVRTNAAERAAMNPC